ncbi:type 1 glutamine amidotransferase domain-containing protein [Dolosicoccus paucivorans]|uniref:type 1 glutamine amidotransferase domain-containing protein n=1 Tax=Dolosicoccus paucivorans TaxID=84521 RepID=UPI00087EEF39|nr:type 1 glutamine amidotransferase domain-containing protein [Dolosicoccus paucivorans]SDI97096.1 Putative intracellular protease/amidase [Dolosicoccus paucivorans]
MKKVLIVLTNTAKYETENVPTGLWLGELTHFYDEIQKHGIEADFVSPKGGYVPIDPYSMKFATDVDYKWYQEDAFVNKALAQTKSPQDIDPKEYCGIYYTGGHGVLWDFPQDETLQHIAMAIYKEGGYVTAVCHGVVGLLNLTEDGHYLIKNKQVTGFTDVEELLAGKKNKVPFSTEEALKQRGAHYVKKRFFTSFATRDGRVITGQNPQSARAVAKELVKAIN